jgi:Uri superfamily endonuclease
MKSHEPGVYTIILRLDSEIEIIIGSLGRLHFAQGYYAYTGSARGPGGLKRVERHLKVLNGSNPARRWHIDYLLPHTSLEKVTATQTNLDFECRVAQIIDDMLPHIPRFGSTDCKCQSHLHYSKNLTPMQKAVQIAHTTIQQSSPKQIKDTPRK